MILLVNQHSVPIFIDIVNAFAAREKVTLFSGFIEVGRVPLSHRVQVVHSKEYNRKSTLSRLFSWLIFSLHYFFYLLVTRKPVRVIVVTNPPFAPLITAIVCGWRNIPYHIIVYDLYPEALAQAGLVKATHFIYRLWKKVNPWMYQKATSIFTLSESMRHEVAKYVLADNNISVIHNWADTAYIKPIDKSLNAFVQRHQLHGRKVVLYSGNMGLTHDLESLIEAAEKLKENNDILFLLIGDGGKKRKLKELVYQKQLTNVLFLPYQSTDDFPLAMAAADIGVVTLGTGAEGISVPSKTYINMAAGLCLLSIAPPESELARLIDQYHIGVICQPNNGIRVATTIVELFSDIHLLNSYKANALVASTSFTSANAELYVEAILK